jgi:uncharacterized membrane protein YfcA
MHFPVSGVECPIWLPPLIAFFVALLATPAGISGAFLLMPFQMSVLGFVSPAVAPTNLIYNIVGVPGGVARYLKEGRLIWPLAWIITTGTLPGVGVGAFVRAHYLVDPRYCKLFVGCVLLYLGVRLLRDAFRPRPAACVLDLTPARMVSTSLRKIEFLFQGDHYSFHPATLASVALIVGVIGGIYGVGGGAIIAPFAMTILGLPAYTVAGAALFGTLLTSVAGVGFFEVSGVRPDWLLGLLFGAGGLFGSYLGARLQKHLPERSIRLFLGLLVTALALQYVTGFLLGAAKGGTRPKNSHALMRPIRTATAGSGPTKR